MTEQELLQVRGLVEAIQNDARLTGEQWQSLAYWGRGVGVSLRRFGHYEELLRISKGRVDFHLYIKLPDNLTVFNGLIERLPGLVQSLRADYPTIEITYETEPARKPNSQERRKSMAMAHFFIPLDHTEMLRDVYYAVHEMANGIPKGDEVSVRTAKTTSSAVTTGANVSDQKHTNARGLRLSVEKCRHLLVMLQQKGADLVGDGIRRPSGRRERSDLKLCRIGDVEISLKLSGSRPGLCVRIDDEAESGRKDEFRSVFGLLADQTSHDIPLKPNVMDGSDFSDAWVSELKTAYSDVLNRLTAPVLIDGSNTCFLSRKFDWRRMQFLPPAGCVDEIRALEGSLLFAMSHGSHELFHTNVWAWLVENHREFARIFFEDIDEDAIVSVRREQGNRDLTIWVRSAGHEKAYVVENKFKSVPRKEQLDEYRTALGDRFAKGLIVTLDALPEGFEVEGWSGKLQSEIVDAINGFLASSSYVNDPQMNLIGDYAKITSQLSTLFSLYRGEMGQRWALALNHSEWDECADGDLESIRMSDIFKKMNAADLETYIKSRPEWGDLERRLRLLGGFLPLRIRTDFLHKLPVLNCDIVKLDPDGMETSIGIILQGASFGRSAWSTSELWNDMKKDGPKAIYEVLRGKWFDDVSFMRPGIVLKRPGARKAYKQYDTSRYSFTYQDVGIESDSFDYLARMIFDNIGRAMDLIERGEVNGYINL